MLELDYERFKRRFVSIPEQKCYEVLKIGQTRTNPVRN